MLQLASGMCFGESVKLCEEEFESTASPRSTSFRPGHPPFILTHARLGVANSKKNLVVREIADTYY